MLRIWDVYLRSRILGQKAPDPDPGSGSAKKNLIILPKKLLLSSRKYDPDFFPSRIRIRKSLDPDIDFRKKSYLVPD
jgi:hypothetical protein